ncbi:MAG: HTTM domain-containing protein [Myxococcota bacterium]
MFAKVRATLSEPVDVASLAMLRTVFGLLMCAGLVRLQLTGWVEPLFTAPRFTFTYQAFAWIPHLPAAWVSGVIWLAAAAALAFALDLFPRVSGAVFVALFAWLQLFDVTNYLNHYYLVVLLGALLTVLPTSWRHGQAPRWVLWLVRFQVGIVYFYAGLAKAGSDWLLHAQPLSIWFAARTETPLIGPLLAQPWAAYAAAWFGFLYDLTIVLWLSWRKTRPFAYLVLLVFHTLTFVFFDIGMFPFIMSTAALIFFPPDWPRRFLGRWPRSADSLAAPRPIAAPVMALVAAYCAFQLLFPLRHFVLPGDVLWNEDGMRWSWKVMVREKNGAVTYRVRDPRSGREWQVSPSAYLLPRQANEMSGQPDLILQLAHHVARDFAARGVADVEVRVDAWVSLNGRAPRLLVDPSVDLAKVEDSAWGAAWVMPAPEEPPLPALRSREVTAWR